jgi:hypothetical protein
MMLKHSLKLQWKRRLQGEQDEEAIKGKTHLVGRKLFFVFFPLGFYTVAGF